MNKSFWSIDYTPLTLITIPACVALNYVGKFIAAFGAGDRHSGQDIFRAFGCSHVQIYLPGFLRGDFPGAITI